jgi:hypothetical protein
MAENLIEKYSQLYGSPYLTWIFMWVNAIKDIALFVDGPDCIFYKSDMLYKTHDLYSDLKQASIDTKLYFSWVMPNKMIRWYDNKIKRKLWLINENPKFNLWVVTCMPVTGLLATQYNNIYWDFEKDFIFIPSFTDKFRIDWYSIFLKELAKNIQLDEKKEKNKFNISIIWYLFDRNEWDNFWNIEELKRIMWLIWVEINSIWLNWWNYSDLSKVEKSELLVSLPYWKYASKVLKKKLEVDVLELDIPFWLKNTINFVKSIWEKLWIDKRLIDNIISSEFKKVKNKIDLLNEKRFLNKNFVYAWDPFLETSIKDIWDFLWMNHIKTYSYTWSKQAKYQDIWDINIDLVIWNSDFSFWWNDTIKFEFGFPSYNTHFLTNRAFMGFEWVLNFVERLYEKLW